MYTSRVFSSPGTKFPDLVSVKNATFLHFVWALAAVLGCAGCGVKYTPHLVTLESPPPGLDGVRVVKIFHATDSLGGEAGTAVPLGRGAFITALHCLSSSSAGVPRSLWMDGQVVPIDIVRSGDLEIMRSGSKQDRILHDWAKFSIPQENAARWDQTGTIVDFTFPLKEGQIIYLVGFPIGVDAEGISFSAGVALKKTILRGTVVAPANSEELPPPDRVFFVNTNQLTEFERFQGLSGGPAVVYDDKHDRWVIVGICQGGAQAVFTPDFPLAQKREILCITVVRPPLSDQQ